MAVAKLFNNVERDWWWMPRVLSLPSWCAGSQQSLVVPDKATCLSTVSLTGVGRDCTESRTFLSPELMHSMSNDMDFQAVG